MSQERYKLQLIKYKINNMKRFIIYFLALCCVVDATAQNEPITKSNYELPARFTPKRLKQMSSTLSVSPHFLPDGETFWYKYSTAQGSAWYIVDAQDRTQKPLFDNASMAAQITEIVQDPYDAEHLPISTIRFNDDSNSFIFEVLSTVDMTKEEREEYEEYRQKLDSEDKESQEKALKEPKKRSYFLEYNLSTSKVTELEDYRKPHANPSWASISPDKNTIIFARNYNLYYMDKENFAKAVLNAKDSTIVEHQITKDGNIDFAWGGKGYSQKNTDVDKDSKKRAGAYVIWSPDSKHFLIQRTDNSKVGDLWVINNVAKPRPVLESYKYHMPGEKNAPQSHLYIFETATKKSQSVDIAAFQDQTFSVFTKKRTLVDRELLNAPATEWMGGDNSKFFLQRTSRDLKRIDVCSVDIAELKATPIIEERLNTSMESRPIELIRSNSQIISWSQRSGWGHFYLSNIDGKLIRPITKGDFHCERILGYNEDNSTLYFLANGFDKDANPYYSQICSVNIENGKVSILSNSEFDSSIVLSDNNSFFINNFSRVNTTPESGLYNMSGKEILALQTADLSRLFAAGYKFPEPFIVKSADGITDIYGVMYKPFNFDSTKLYPIIEYVYPGPQTEAVNTQFSTSMDRTDRLAQFGFIVITVGNRGGHPNRSKWYHNYGYGDLRDYGLADKKAAVEQLADRYNFIDREKVGIHGHSGGGFMSTAAILNYPDFFKVAVSCAGNHQNNIYNRWWSEKHHGVKEVTNDKGEISFEYSIDKNAELAKNLKGKLMLVTGDMDDNVHPAGTITVVDALIRANKRFDFLLLPGQRHGFGDMQEYFFWKLGDYFSQYLIEDYQDNTDIKQMAK